MIRTFSAICCIVTTLSICSCSATRKHHSSLVRIDHGEGLYYVGEVEDGRANGFGVYYRPNGDVEIGEWRKGGHYGFGCTFNTSVAHEAYSYIGEFKEGSRRGKGALFLDGAVYVGEWSDLPSAGHGIVVDATNVFVGVSAVDYLKSMTNRMHKVWHDAEFDGQ